MLFWAKAENMLEGMNPDTMSVGEKSPTWEGTSDGKAIPATALPGRISQTRHSPVAIARSMVRTYIPRALPPILPKVPLDSEQIPSTLVETEKKIIGTISMHRAFMKRLPIHLMYGTTDGSRVPTVIPRISAAMI